MSDFNQEAPKLLTKLVGHVCGLIFVALASFTLLVAYILISRFSPGLILLLVISTSVTYFFGSTAFRLNGKTARHLFSRRGLLSTAVGTALFSVAALVIVVTGYAQGNFALEELIPLALLSASGLLFSWLFLGYVKRNF